MAAMVAAATSDKVVSLLNDAMLASSTEDRITCLKQIEELIVRKAPELLDNFFEEILQFQTDQSGEVRRELIAFLETTTVKDKGLLPRAAETLSYLLADEKPKVVKRAVQACNAMLVTAFVECALHPRAHHAKPAWDAMTKLSERVLHLRGSVNDGVRVQTFKFMETMVLLYSHKTRGAQARTKDPSLDQVPAQHPFMNPKQMRNAGRQYFSTLIEAVGADTSSMTLITAIVGSLVSIARLRPIFLRRVVMILTVLPFNPPKHLKETQVKSLQRTLKTQLLLLFKHEASIPMHTDMVPVLRQLGTPSHEIAAHDRSSEAETTGKETRASSSSLRPSAVPRPAKRLSSTGRQEPPSKKPTIATPPPWLTLEHLRQRLPPSTLVELVLRTLANLPTELPPHLESEDDGDGAPLNAAATRAAKLKTRGEAGENVQMDEAFQADEEETELAPALPAAMPGELQRDTAPELSRRSRREYRLEALDLDDSERETTLAALAKELVREEVEGPIAPTLINRERIRAIGSLTAAAPLAIARVPQLGDTDLNVDGGVAEELLPPLARALLRRLMKNPDDNAEFCISLLYQAWLSVGDAGAPAIKTEDGATPENGAQVAETTARHLYEALFLQILRQARSVAGPESSLPCRLVLEAPMISSAVLAEADLGCQDPQSMVACFAALRGAAQLRPPCRIEALQRLLALTAADDANVHSQAIKTCQHLHEKAPTEMVASAIEEHAVTRLQQGLASDGLAETDPAAHAAAVIKGASLYLALLLKNPTMIGVLTKAYSNAPAASQSALLRATVSIVSALGEEAHGEAFLSSMAPVPRGAETLVMKILDLLTQEVLPPDVATFAHRLGTEGSNADPQFLLPLLPHVHAKTAQEILPFLLRGLKKAEHVKEIFPRLMSTKVSTRLAMRAEKLFMYLHKLNASMPDIPLKTIKIVVDACLSSDTALSPELVGSCLHKLCDMKPIPTLLMWTLLKALKKHPILKSLVVIQLLPRLVKRRIWDSGVLFKGFVHCIQRTQPDSFEVLATLPEAVRDQALAELTEETRDAFLASDAAKSAAYAEETSGQADVDDAVSDISDISA